MTDDLIKIGSAGIWLGQFNCCPGQHALVIKIPRTILISVIGFHIRTSTSVVNNMTEETLNKNLKITYKIGEKNLV